MESVEVEKQQVLFTQGSFKSLSSLLKITRGSCDRRQLRQTTNQPAKELQQKLKAKQQQNLPEVLKKHLITSLTQISDSYNLKMNMFKMHQVLKFFWVYLDVSKSVYVSTSKKGFFSKCSYGYD